MFNSFEKYLHILSSVHYHKSLGCGGWGLSAILLTRNTIVTWFRARALVPPFGCSFLICKTRIVTALASRLLWECVKHYVPGT